MKQQIHKILERVVGQPVPISVPENPQFGDYTTNVALQTEHPKKFAEDLKSSILQDQTASGAGIIDRVEIAGPGFINLYLTEASISSQIEEVLKKKETYGFVPKTIKNKALDTDSGHSGSNKAGQKQGKTGTVQPGDIDGSKLDQKTQKNLRKNADRVPLARQNKKNEQGQRPDIISATRIIVEFADPNPFKEIHIGHVRNIALGESFCRLLEAMGKIVRRANYEGDVGMHVAKALWGLQHGEPLSRAYAAGSKAFEASEEAKKAIGELNIKIYNQDPGITDLYSKGRKDSLASFEAVYGRLGTRFNRYYFESEVAPLGVAMVRNNMNVFELSDGAIVFRGEKAGLHTRVFVTKDGYATYEAKDLALAPLKYKEWPYDLSIIMTGNEQSEYFRVMLAALAEIHPDLAAKTLHIPFGMVNLKSGKMSSRTGDVITATWLIEEAKKRIYVILRNNRTNYKKEQQEHIAEKAAVAAVKYSMLRVTASSDIAFDLDASVSFEGDSGPYLQYTYARCMSVLKKAQQVTIKITSSLNTEERMLARQIIQFPDVVAEAAQNFAPNTLCTYLFHLAQQFNLFYAKHEILGNETRLTLTAATAQVLKNGLYLLGIDVLEMM